METGSQAFKGGPDHMCPSKIWHTLKPSVFPLPLALQTDSFFSSTTCLKPVFLKSAFPEPRDTDLTLCKFLLRCSISTAIIELCMFSLSLFPLRWSPHGPVPCGVYLRSYRMPHTKGFQRHMLRAQSASRNSAVPSLRSQSCEQLSVKTSQDSTMTQDGLGLQKCVWKLAGAQWCMPYQTKMVEARARDRDVANSAASWLYLFYFLESLSSEF